MDDRYTQITDVIVTPSHRCTCGGRFPFVFNGFFLLQKKTKGQAIMDHVYWTLDLDEKDYFGLAFQNEHEEKVSGCLSLCHMYRKPVEDVLRWCSREDRIW